MKELTKTLYRRCFFALIGMLLLSACSHSGLSGDLGTITINLGNSGARAVSPNAVWPAGLPSQMQYWYVLEPDMYHEITVKNPTTLVTFTRTLPPYQTSTSFNVPEDTWDVTVKAIYRETDYWGDYYPDVTYASGTSSVTVIAGQSNPCPVTMAEETVFFVVTNDTEWGNATGDIFSGGNGMNYLIKFYELSSPPISITNTTPAASFTFGPTNNINVNIRGYSIPINISSPGSFLRVSGSQTVVLNNIELQWTGGPSNNTALIYTAGTIEMNFSHIQDNDGGSGVHIDGGRLEMNGGSISDNINASPGGVNITANGTFIINKTSFDAGVVRGNISSGIAGGVYVGPGCTFIMHDGSISFNYAGASLHGGGVYVDNGYFEMNGGSLGYNHADFGNGGGVNIANGGVFTMNDNASVVSNVAASGGGGVFVGLSCSFTMTGGEICLNQALSASLGGGVLLGGGTFTMSNMYGGNPLIHENDAGAGGGVYIVSGTFTMQAGIINGIPPYSTYLPNTAITTNSRALWVDSGGTAQYGDLAPIPLAGGFTPPDGTDDTLYGH